jgi:hypothetical protein
MDSCNLNLQRLLLKLPEVKVTLHRKTPHMLKQTSLRIVKSRIQERESQPQSRAGKY